MKKLSNRLIKKRPRIQGAAWRRLDNTAKLFAAVSGEDLSSVFRIAAVLKEPVEPELLHNSAKFQYNASMVVLANLHKAFDLPLNQISRIYVYNTLSESLDR